jgi:hypothetical protein
VHRSVLLHQADNRIRHQLPRPVPGHVAATLRFDQFDSIGRKDVFGLGAATECDDGRGVLNEYQIRCVIVATLDPLQQTVLEV